VSKTDWRLLPQIKNEYVSSVFGEVFDFPMNEASDHVVLDIERLFYFRINKEDAINLMLEYKHHDFEYLLEMKRNEFLREKLEGVGDE